VTREKASMPAWNCCQDGGSFIELPFVYDDWPQFRNSYLRRICEAFRKKSKSLRYRGELAVHAGVEVEGTLHLKKDALRIEGTLYYNGITEDALTRTEGMLVRFSSGRRATIPVARTCDLGDLLTLGGLEYYKSPLWTGTSFSGGRES